MVTNYLKVIYLKSGVTNIRKVLIAQPKGFSQKAHCAGRKKKESINEEAINIKSIITPAIKKLDKIFKDNDYEVRIVGGAVRDIALGKEPKDIDFIQMLQR